ncbi:NACHT domain-containing protein [Paucibacter sp. B51]|uniref:NACHT domain-containing protein n=1 Tax=Paucibacter sp. B51 TaxID=2993315 RepID=UPI0022EBD003|nr:NACHT domain-containing protein [Paucibacter sp. B51]
MFMPDSPLNLEVASLASPADGVPTVRPVATREQVLPFGRLTWENFERLCYRLVRLDADVEHAARYGRQGDAQEGLDIYVRQGNGRYHCVQAKRHKAFSSAQLAEAVDLFLAGSWASRSERFTIVVQASLRSAAVQDEAERQATRLSASGIVFNALDGEDLTDRLRAQPLLIDDFFGRPWVSALLGEDAAATLNSRLDGEAFSRARNQLANVYRTQFHYIDPGSFGSTVDADARPALTLLERYLKPDVLVQEASPTVDDGGLVGDDPGSPVSERDQTTPRDQRVWKKVTESVRARRLPLDEWFGNAQWLAVLGDAGSGKSTLLRVIALDILQHQLLFPELASRWGQHLPVYIPFARWSAQTARDGGIVGIKEIVRRSVEHLMTQSLANLIDQAIDDGRVLLLIDGLDEWSNEQAARTTLSALVTSVEAHGIPAIVSGRPRGLDRIGALPSTWQRARIANLSVPQQRSIASRWFVRFSSSSDGSSGASDASLRVDRFMYELTRDTNLGALASTPLLLIGLVTLALRGQILPRTRGEIYNQLVRVLLEVHPNSRATASGDTEPRYRYASEDQRRAAIAYLAFFVRKNSGGAGISTSLARDTLRSYLSSPDGIALDGVEATRAATEILSVNSETQGLIVEKAPGEVGFVHASFEEYLGAEHIGSWPFLEIEEFVRANVGQSRWRNVVANLLGYVQRRDEFDRLVAIIEEPGPDDVSQLNKQAVLGDIAFGVTIRAAPTAKRLAQGVMEAVETQDWMPTRREALASVLNGLSDPGLKADVERKVVQWLPARISWRTSLVSALGGWAPTDRLQETLFRAMHDEDRSVRRSAAAAYAKVFSAGQGAQQRLLRGLAHSRDLHASVAMLESLALGWADAEQSVELFQEAAASRRDDLRLVGTFGLMSQGLEQADMRDGLLRAQNFWSGVSREYQAVASWMLQRYWPNHADLIKGAVARMTGLGESIWERDSAASYLLACDIHNADLRRWVLNEFSSQYPFDFHFGDDSVWRQIGRFAASDAEIRSAAIAYWKNPENRIIGMRNMVSFASHVADAELAAVFRLELAEGKQGFNRYWALQGLLAGWGRDHVEVSSTIDALVGAPDDQLEQLVSMMPEIYRDKAAARERLLRMSERPNMRGDLLTEGLARCGSDGSDQEAVQAVMKFPERKGIFDPSPGIFQWFGSHPKVRALAANRLRCEEPPIAAIAQAYADDVDFGPLLLSAAVPLPVGLRAQVVEFAIGSDPGTFLGGILDMAMQECDPDLRVRMAIAKYGAVAAEGRDESVRELLGYAVAVGPDYESIRAAALAGLIVIGALDRLAQLHDQGKPVALFTGNALHSMPSLERLICERFSELESVFGESLLERIGRSGRQSGLASILSVAPNASPAAKAAFSALADQGKLPLSSNALRALAGERPRSQVLLDHCWKVLAAKDYNNGKAMLNAEVAEILRTHFPEDKAVRQSLVTLFNQGHNAVSEIALAVYAPNATEFGAAPATNRQRHFADWAVGVLISAARDNPVTFVELLKRMVTRELPMQFDAQDSINLAVHERLQRDPEVVSLLGKQLRLDVDGSISGSFARYLASAGKLDESARASALGLLQSLAADQRLVVVGYDAVAASSRALRATLLDAVTAGLELS